MMKDPETLNPDEALEELRTLCASRDNVGALPEWQGRRFFRIFCHLDMMLCAGVIPEQWKANHATP